MQFDYFYGSQAEQFSFYRIPKVLFTDPQFKPLSTDAKVLYGILLDRMSLSVKNHWLDEQSRVYIIFTTEEIMEALSCANQKACRLMLELEMVRQGNMNKEVSIFIYITEATFDAYSYQLVENKQKFISQIMTSKSPARSCEDLDEAALSYAEVKALAAGNPMIKEKMDLDIQVARLRTLKAAYNSQHYRLEDAVTGIFLREIRGTECRIQAFEKDMQTAKDSQSYDKDGKLVFSIELDGTSYDKREDAGKALLGLVGAAVRADHHVLVGHYAGFEVTVAYVPLSKVFVAHLVGQATHTTELGSDAAGNMVRLQNVVAALPQEVSGLRNNLQQLRVQLDSAKEELQQPFLQEQELNDKSARLAELDALLNVGNDAPVLEGEAEVVNEDDSVRTPREENELER